MLIITLSLHKILITIISYINDINDSSLDNEKTEDPIFEIIKFMIEQCY